MKDKKRVAIEFIVLFGIISALGDVTYEGARSVYGTYLASLGAGAAAIGFITGLGEFLGYAFRLVSGFIVDKTGKDWPITILGYALLLSVPLLGLTNTWQIAAIFVLFERLGKAVRSPGKSSMLSHATKHVGTGFGFGILEAVDQMGALVGPLVFTAALSFTGTYKSGFKFMLIPALLTIAIIIYARIKVPNPKELEDEIKTEAKISIDTKKLYTQKFIFYSLFIFFSIVGFVNFPILSYHFLSKNVIKEGLIPTLYAVAMGVDGLFALIIGKYYDKKGVSALVFIPILSVPLVFLGFSLNTYLAIISIILWGIVMSIHETILKAAIADITTKDVRGRAYGIFYTIYGISMLIGSVIMGALYENSITYILVFATICQIIAYIFYYKFKNINA